ncbi:AAA family ATPase [Aliarcobacter butzleri]|uniref:ATP-dependent nuclease n=1 Tax=Aliarcobacter butzleri TaxID=28197 RepID=UPI001EDB85E6|nr:TOPRIM nucleotidyl transferase/hydrolase domain-containing protein [Aliarcobacter butzleri]MCG3651782.1 AAA family ATPase [Aliarcobacter butzleri]
MYEIDLKLNLQVPWKNENFEMSKIGYINYLVGPNGTGKSQFSEQLKNFFNSKSLKCRILSADRLTGLGFSNKEDIHGNYIGYGSYVIAQSNFSRGFDKGQFEYYKMGAEELNSGIDAFIFLEEKLDLKIKIEAILSQVLHRDIRLEWDSGKLVPKAYNVRQGSEYELKKESHGVKELLILLTHLYDDSHNVLIIDEPELNLHPQYQAFLLEHIRKVSGNPADGKKIVYLITHSPFILDFQTITDLKSVICFHSDFRKPSFIESLEPTDEEKIKQIIPKLNVHHKQLFFANTPIFVEGIFDAQFIKAIQEKRGVSLEGSGSTVIDVGGNEQLSSYYLLSKFLGKKSLFIYDLDSIFFSNQLRINAEGSEEINQFLIDLGMGSNFKDIWGQFDSTLKKLKSDLRTKESLYKSYIEQLDTDKKEKKEGYALLVYIKHFRDEANKQATNLTQIDLLLNQLGNVIKSFEEIGVYILGNGAMENYFPSYDGNKFNIDDSKKRDCLNSEIDWMINECQSNDELKTRYGELYKIMEKLPSGDKIDYKKVIESNLKDLIHKIQKGLSENKINDESNLSSYIGKDWNSYQRILSISNMHKENQTFTIILKDLWGFGEEVINIEKSKNYSSESFI